MKTPRLSFIEKTGYSMADAAANFVFMTMILFQLNYGLNKRATIEMADELARRRAAAAIPQC
jgi:hypothetical protein